MKVFINAKRAVGAVDPKIYGHFIEHFHRQIYSGVYDPGSPFADEAGLRTDVLEAMRKIRVPVLSSLRYWRNRRGYLHIPLHSDASSDTLQPHPYP